MIVLVLFNTHAEDERCSMEEGMMAVQRCMAWQWCVALQWYAVLRWRIPLLLCTPS